jgi:hypothetical protein
MQRRALVVVLACCGLTLAASPSVGVARFPQGTAFAVGINNHLVQFQVSTPTRIDALVRSPA